MLAVNTWQLSELTEATSIRWILVLMAMRGLALGSTVQSTYATALGTVKRKRVARGSSLINSMRFVVQSIAVAVLATIVASYRDDQVRGFEAAYRLTFWFSLLALALGALLPGWPGAWGGREALAKDAEAEGGGRAERGRRDVAAD